MSNSEFKKIVEDICVENKINKDLFYIASVCKGKHIKYDFSKNTNQPHQKYIIRYFQKYDAVVIWNTSEHIPSTKILTLSKKDLLKAIDENNFCIKKGVEYRWWKLTNSYVSNLSNISDIILKCQ